MTSNNLLIKIDEKIVKHLEYFKNKKNFSFIDKILEHIEYDGYEYFFNIKNNLKNNEINSIVHIELIDEKDIKIDDPNKIKVWFRKKNGEMYFQIWKCGRFLNLLLKDIIKERNYDYVLFIINSIILGSHTISSLIKKYNLNVILDKKVSDYYVSYNYMKGEGSLHNSCMNDEIGKVMFYDIINNVNIFAIVNSSKEIFARALLWKTDKGLYLDRCYTVNDIFQYGIYIYAMEKYNVKCIYPIEDDYYMQVKIDEKNTEDLILFFLNNKEIGIPYFDTFKYFRDDSDSNIIICNKNINDSKEIKNIVHYITKLIFYKFNDLKIFNIFISKSDQYDNILASYIPLESSQLLTLIDMFDIHRIEILFKDEILFTFYMLSVNAILKSRNINKFYFLIGNTSISIFDDDDDDEYKITYNILNNINDIIEKSDYNNYKVLGYYDYNNKDIVYIDETIKDIYVMYVKSKDLRKFMVISSTLSSIYHYYKRKHMLIGILQNFKLLLNLNTMEIIMYKEVNNDYITEILNKSRYESLKEEYKEELKPVLGNFADVVFYNDIDFDDDDLIQKLRNKLIYISDNYFEFLKSINKYSQNIHKIIINF